jgi:hypothetical protein
MSATIGLPLLGNGLVNKFSEQQRGCVFCVIRAEGLQRDKEVRLSKLSRSGSSSGDGNPR